MTNSAALSLTQVRSEVGVVSVLVNNAGIVSGKKFFDVSDKLSELTFQVNTIAHLWVREWRGGH